MFVVYCMVVVVVLVSFCLNFVVYFWWVEEFCKVVKCMFMNEKFEVCNKESCKLSRVKEVL